MSDDQNETNVVIEQSLNPIIRFCEIEEIELKESADHNCCRIVQFD
jgi:hypothetical protein